MNAHTYAKPTKEQPLILPMSSIALFRKCRKAYELGYERNINPGKTSDAAALGTRFHEYAAACHKGKWLRPDADDPMSVVWDAYRESHTLPKDILHVEDPIYTRIAPATYLRTTFDLVYRNEHGWVVARDYKTFEKQPALDVDLDFQGRIYTAVLMRQYKTDKVLFEYEYVRRVPPGTKNAKGVWRHDECYTNVPLIISRREADLVWDEMLQTVADIRLARNVGRFYRSGTRKEFGSPCLGCFYSELCKAELYGGELSDDDVQLLSAGYKERLQLP
jgi:hypothetical protein